MSYAVRGVTSGAWLFTATAVLLSGIESMLVSYDAMLRVIRWAFS